MAHKTYNPRISLLLLLSSVGVAGVLSAAGPQVVAHAQTSEGATENVATELGATDTTNVSNTESAESNELGESEVATPSTNTLATGPENGSASVVEDTATLVPETKATAENTLENVSDSQPLAANTGEEQPASTDGDSNSQVSEVDTDKSAQDVVIRTSLSDTHVVDAQGGQLKAGDKVALWTYNGGNNQTWDIVSSDAKDYYFVQAHGTDKVLDIEYAIPKSGQRVLLWNKTGADNQLWKIDKKDGLVRFISKLNEDLALNVSYAAAKDGSQLIVWSASGAANEWFQVMPKNVDVLTQDQIDEGVYTIAAGSKGGFVVSDQSSSGVTLAKSTGDPSQRVVVSSTGDGFYSLSFESSGLVLGAKDGSIVATTPVSQG